MPLAIRKIARSMRGCIIASLLLNLAAVLAPVTASAKPLIPLLSFLQHWDHHWYAWLPGDPIYEAVEVMATERSGQEPLVGVYDVDALNAYMKANSPVSPMSLGRIARVD